MMSILRLNSLRNRQSLSRFWKSRRSFSITKISVLKIKARVYRKFRITRHFLSTTLRDLNLGKTWFSFHSCRVAKICSYLNIRFLHMNRKNRLFKGSLTIFLRFQEPVALILKICSLTHL